MKASIVKVRDVVVENTGSRNPTKIPNESFIYIDVAAVDNSAKAITGARPVIGSDAPSRARKLIRQGDVLVSTVRPNLNAVAMVPPELDGQVASTGFCVLRATERVLPEYLYYFTRARVFVDSLTLLVAGAMYPAVTDSHVFDQELPLPSLSEQRRIVDILSRAEGIVQLRREAEKKAAELIPALFLDMFGEPATNPKGWPVKTVGDVLDSADYGSSTKASADGSGLPLIRMGNVDSSGALNLSDLKFVELSDVEIEKYRLLDGDILFNRTNSKDLVGKTGLWCGQFDAIVASYFIRLRTNQSKMKPAYLWAFMNSRHMKRVLFETARGAIGQANINSKELKAFSVAVPPLKLQQHYTERLDEIRSIQAQQANATANAKATFDALLAQVFRAEVN